MKSVAVLMSTYNGERFLEEQIDSILNQQGVRVGLYVRDDGSSDRTQEILNKYGDKITLVKGSNVGVGNSFMNLVYAVPDEFDYYAFADQDDIWLDEKLLRAAETIGDSEEPELYCSNQTLVDKDGNYLSKRYTGPVNTSPRQILCQNKIAGCTMVWNRSLQTIAGRPSRRPSPELLRIRIHDVWMMMVASCIGRIHYDQESYILYRQHENNVVGVRKTNIVEQWKKKIKRPELRRGRSTLCREILEKYGDLIPSETVGMLKKYAYYNTSLKSKAALLRDEEIIKITGESRLMFTAKVMADLF